MKIKVIGVSDSVDVLAQSRRNSDEFQWVSAGESARKKPNALNLAWKPVAIDFWDTPLLRTRTYNKRIMRLSDAENFVI